MQYQNNTALFILLPKMEKMLKKQNKDIMYYQPNQDRSCLPRCCAFLCNAALLSSVYIRNLLSHHDMGRRRREKKWNFGKNWVLALHRSIATAPFCLRNVASCLPLWHAKSTVVGGTREKGLLCACPHVSVCL